MNYIKLSILITLSIMFTNCSNNPYPDVKWIEDYPGVTDRYVTFTPVLKSNQNVILGPTIGADYGKLYFKDINGNGKKEAIIETKILFDVGEYNTYSKSILESYTDSLGLQFRELKQKAKIK